MSPIIVALALALAPVGIGPADHDGCYYEEDCYGDYGGEQDYSSNDRNRNRGRERGAFSPGPFDRSPVDFSGSCISLNCSGRDERDRDRQPAF